MQHVYTYQVIWDRGIYGPGDDEADGVLSRLAQDGGDLLGAHAPQPHVPDGQQVVAILQAPVLQRGKEICFRKRLLLFSYIKISQKLLFVSYNPYCVYSLLRCIAYYDAPPDQRVESAVSGSDFGGPWEVGSGKWEGSAD